MPCKHYDHGQCRAQAHDVTRTRWIGLLAVGRVVTEYPACTYSNAVWVGNLCVPGATSIGPAPRQSDCALYDNGAPPPPPCHPPGMQA
jgi:hypothetical protein